MERNDFTEVSM